MREKKSIRSDILKKRKNVSRDLVISAERSIEENLLPFVDNMEKSLNRKLGIMSYMSVNGEFPTHSLNKTLISSGHRLMLPYTDPEFIIHPYYARSLNALTVSKYGIPEPDPATSEGPSSPPDLVIMPGVAFDTSGSRIGFGKGCYDRFLSALPSLYGSSRKPVLAALAYSFQVLDRIPSDPHDIPCSVIFTEQGIVYCG